METARLFQNGMILQRDKCIPIWGKAAPGADVEVHIQGQVKHGKADAGGNWMVTIEPLTAASSVQMTISDGNEQLVLSDVAVGDVFIAGGQSNMEFHMRYEQFKEQELSVCRNDSIRFYDVPEIAYDGQDGDFDYEKTGIWRKASPEELDYFSAPGYYFAKQMYQELGIPIGIVGLNWGGTRSCSWMSEERADAVCPEQVQDFRNSLNGQPMETVLKNAGKNPMNDRGFGSWDPALDFVMSGTPGPEEIAAFFAGMGISPDAMTQFAQQPELKHRPGCLYSHMVLKTAPFGVKGVLWYQGESDDDIEGSAAHYEASLEAIMADWRKAWGETLPFFIVQLPGFRSWMGSVNKNFTLIREAQQRVCAEDENAYLCSISDLGAEWDIHPKNKRDVGLRLALLALEHLYHKDVEADPPCLRHGIREGNCITLRFSHVGSGLYIQGDGIAALSVKESGTDAICSCTVEGDGMTIQLPGGCESPVEIDFARTDWYQVNLFNSTGIPAVPFRICC